MITATLAISDGWNCNGPTSNHACAPLRDCAEHEHADQQRQHREVDERPQVAELAGSRRDHHDHRDDAEHDRERPGAARSTSGRCRCARGASASTSRSSSRPSALMANGSASSTRSTWRSGLASPARGAAVTASGAAVIVAISRAPSSSASTGSGGAVQARSSPRSPGARSAPRSARRGRPLRRPRPRRTSARSRGKYAGEQRRVTLPSARCRPARYRSCPRPGSCRAGSPANAAYAVPSSSAVDAGEARRASAARTFGSNATCRIASGAIVRGPTLCRSASRTSCSMCGFHSVPPFANAAYALASCSGVDGHAALADRHEDVVGRDTTAPCSRFCSSVGHVAFATACFHSGSGTCPSASSSSTPVVAPKPNSSRRRLQPEARVRVAVVPRPARTRCRPCRSRRRSTRVSAPCSFSAPERGLACVR